jgi:hypothetical protein
LDIGEQEEFLVEDARRDGVEAVARETSENIPKKLVLNVK